MTPVRIGLLSFAHYHANFWAEAFRADPRAHLAGIWDDDAARGTAAAARFGAAFVADLDALLDRVDAVAVCSETARHRPLIEAAATRGLHVLCEKPLAATLADAEAIRSHVARVGVRFMQSFPKRTDPVNHELRALVAAGALGRVTLVRVRHGHSHGTDPAFTGGWWADPALSGGGTLIDEGIHAADLLRWLFGMPDTVQATTSNAALGLRVEDSAAMLLTWPGGLIGEVATGWTMRAADHSVELYGTEGTALLSGVDLASRDTPEPGLRVYRAGSGWSRSETAPRFAAGGFHQQGPVRFLDGLCGGGPFPAGLDDGVAALRIVRAAYDAAHEGVRCSLA